LAGQGIALALYPMASAYLAHNELVELLDTDIRLGGYYLVISPSCREDPLMARFRAWLEDHLGRLEDGARSQPQT
jgi:DNA-binding transcriptional LysR family regulator